MKRNHQIPPGNSELVQSAREQSSRPQMRHQPEAGRCGVREVNPTCDRLCRWKVQYCLCLLRLHAPAAEAPRRQSKRSTAERFASAEPGSAHEVEDRKSTRLNSSHSQISYAVFCLKKKKKKKHNIK